jgi:arabinogalactan oligomer/maltooligosaccharide transport system permease protein
VSHSDGAVLKESRWSRIWPHLVLVPVTSLILFPVLLVLRKALAPGQGFQTELNPFAGGWTLEHFEEVTSAKTSEGEWLFGPQLWNSIVVSLATTVVGVALATTAAYAFSRFRFYGRNGGMTMFLVTQMFPGVLMLIPLFVIMNELGLLDGLLGLIIVYSTTAIPFCVWMLKGYFDTIPRELEESAIMDGAGRFTIFVRIILPLAAPAIAVTALFSFMTAWNEFVLAFTFNNDPLAQTLPVTIQRYADPKSTLWGSFAAASIIVSIPVMALFYRLQNFLVSGLTAGSVKG